MILITRGDAYATSDAYDPDMSLNLCRVAEIRKRNVKRIYIDLFFLPTLPGPIQKANNECKTDMRSKIKSKDYLSYIHIISLLVA